MYKARCGNSKSRGFTLIEMMIALAVVAILAAIALPSFQESVIKARRSDGLDALLYVQQLQEKYRANHTDFGTLIEIGYAAAAPALSSDGYYTVTTTGEGSGTAYTVTAAAVAGKSQVSDTSNPVNCTTLTLTVTATNPRGVKAPAQCWTN